MAESYQIHTGDGSTTQFAWVKQFISRSHVKVYLDDVDTSFTWVNDGLVQISPAPGVGVEVKIQRETPTTALVDFQTSGTITEANLDSIARQGLFVGVEYEEQVGFAVANAEASETNAAASASAAATSETNAAASETAAAASETAAGTSETNAAASASAASTSETNAAASESAASASATAAGTSETNAASSASAASTSASNASTSATNAAASETAAGTSETNAAASAGAASTSETNAAASEAAAGTSETNAAASASTASTAATNAGTSETNAASSASAASTSAGNAATSETNAANSASAAGTSETNAAASEAAAAATYDSFDDRYLGSKAVAPTLDNDGNALIEGALYWNSVSKDMNVWSGSAWEVAYNPATAGVDSFETRTGAVSLLAGDVDQAYVTQHQAALAITESQITDLGNYALVGHSHVAGDIISGTFGDARISQSSVTQHQGALSLAASQIASGTLADARVAQTNVTQHQAALSITESQISDLGSYITATSTNTLSNKILGDNTSVTDPASANWTGTEVLNVSAGLQQDISLTGNVTTLTDQLNDGESIMLMVNDGAGYTISWPTITWVSGSGVAPALQSATDTVVSIWKSNGTLFGFAANGA